MSGNGPRRPSRVPEPPRLFDADWPPPPSHRAAETQTFVVEEYGTGGVRALFRRVGWAAFGEVINLVGTALLFIVLADQLGTVDWGSLQAVVSVAIIVGPLVTFGANWQLIRRVVVSDDPAREVGRAVSVATIGTGGAAAAMVLVAVAVPGLFADVSRLTIALILVARMPAYWLVELAATAAVSRGDLRLSTIIRILVVGIRLWGLMFFVAVGGATIDTWAWYFVATELVAAAAAHGLLARSDGRWPRLGVPPAREFSTGFPYGLGNTTEGVLAASDRPVLKQYGFDAATGIYAAGYRVVSLGFIPLMALLRAQDRRFFRQGASGSAATHRAGLAMSRHGLVATVPVTIGLCLLAPYFDLLLSEEWSEAESVIRVLALLPVVKGVQFSFGNALTAAGNQGARLWLTGAAAAANFVGNLIFIPRYSWKAAAGTTLVAEVGLTIGFVVASATYARTRPGQSR